MRPTTLAEEDEAEIERTLTGEWPAVRLEEVSALDEPTRPVSVDLEALRASCGAIVVVVKQAR